MVLSAQIFLFYIEGFLMTLSGLYLFNLPIKMKRVCIVSALHAFFTYIVRGVFLLYHFPFGTHSLIIWFLLFLAIKNILKLSWLQSMLVTLMGIGLLLFGEGVFLLPIMKFLGVDMVTMSQNVKTILLATVVTDIPMLFTIFISSKIKNPLIDLGDLDDPQKMKM